MLPRTRRPDRTALILGVLAVLSIAVFWSGVTPVLASGALAVTSERGQVSRAGRVGQIAAVVASVLVLVVSITQTRVFRPRQTQFRAESLTERPALNCMSRVGVAVPGFRTYA